MDLTLMVLRSNFKLENDSKLIISSIYVIFIPILTISNEWFGRKVWFHIKFYLIKWFSGCSHYVATFLRIFLFSLKILMYRESLVGSVIQTTGTVEFEDGLGIGVLPGGCWCPWGGCTYPRINSKPPWGCGLVLGWVWLSEGPHFRPNSNLLGSAHRWY